METNQARDEYFDQLIYLTDCHLMEKDSEKEEELKERILSISFDHVVELKARIEELETLNSKRGIETAKQDPLI